MLYVFNTLAPIGILVLTGALLRRFGFGTAGFFRAINRLVFWVALPALLFEKIATPVASGAEAMRIFGLLLTVTFICVAAGYLAARFRRMPPAATGAFVQGAFRGNLAYVGLPVLLFSLVDALPETARAVESAAVLALAPLIPIYNITAVFVLLAGQASGAGRSAGATVWHAVRKMVTNPLILACAAGFIFSAAEIPLPLFARRSLVACGQMALPLSLIAIGASLSFGKMGGELKRPLGAAMIKVFLAPLLGYFLGGFFGLSGLSLRAAMIFLACPTAVTSFVMAEQLGGDAELAGRIVILTTLLAFPALALVLLF